MKVEAGCHLFISCEGTENGRNHVRLYHEFDKSTVRFHWGMTQMESMDADQKKIRVNSCHLRHQFSAYWCSAVSGFSRRSTLQSRVSAVSCLWATMSLSVLLELHSRLL